MAWRAPAVEAVLGVPVDATSLSKDVLQHVVDIAAREGEQLDFKAKPHLPETGPSTAPSTTGGAPEKGWSAEQEFAQDVCAFANHVGGLLLVGVRDEDEVAVEVMDSHLHRDPPRRPTCAGRSVDDVLGFHGAGRQRDSHRGRGELRLRPTLFRHWVDANGDCQNARAEVLLSEAEPDTPITYANSSQCTVASGRWFSYYDRVSWTLASDIDIDHMVPLAEAWGSGAAGWTSPRREAYANDLGDYRTLVGVTDNVNQSKGDQDPATWLPTYDKCRYVAEWLAVKIRWGLTADSTEKSVLNSYASTCSNTITVTLA